MEGLDDAHPVETRSRRKGRASRAMNDVEEVEAATQTEDQPMAEEIQDPPEDYTDDEESVDDDAVYEPGNDGMEDEEDWEEICSDKDVGAGDADAAATPIFATANAVEDDTEAGKERLIDELMEGEEDNGGEEDASG
ncbi:unnamed protein product [Closterium sp. Naga37s-1]|nr:unnamed protein product [Closterium sp. Naga37s-1]